MSVPTGAVGRVPDETAGRFGRSLMPAMTNHDTSERPLPSMRLIFPMPEEGEGSGHRVIAIHGVGLESEPSTGQAP